MALDEIAYLNSVGIDVPVTTSGVTFALPPGGTANILIKNIGTAEAFVKGSQGNDPSLATAATASAAWGMSFMPGIPETYRVFSTVTSNQLRYITVIGTAATTLRVYNVSGA